MRVLAYGLGRSGLALLELCRKQGHELYFMENRANGADIDAASALGATRLREPTDAARIAQVCVAAPGVPIDHPDLQTFRDHGVEVIGEVEWVYRTIDSEIIGITGTAGKGTVTSWLTYVLKANGIDAYAGGNIDPALARVARPDSTAVVELSSFQLERCPTLRPKVAAVLNLGVDHLDRHRDVSTYHRAKRNLISNLQDEDLFVYNADDPTLRSWARESTARTAGFSLQGPAAAWRDANGDLWLHGELLLNTAQLAVEGSHNHANALAVALLAYGAGLDVERIRGALPGFTGLLGRYSVVARTDRIAFIEDSIATRELAVRAALEATDGPVVWIAGGRSKGADLQPLEDLVRERVRLFVGIGEAGEPFARVAGQWVPAHVVTEPDGRAALREAVRLACRTLEQDGGTVLFAPLAASFDQFGDYRERAQVFREVVQEEVQWTPSS